MSSIINAFRNIIGDKAWFLKTVLMAIPVFMVINYEIGGEEGLNEIKIALYLAVLFVYIGCGTYLMNRNINNNSPILPSLLGIPELLFHSFFSTIIVVPGIALCSLAIKLFSNYLFFDMKTTIILYALIIIFFCPFIFIPLCLYAAEGKIQDSIKLKPLLDGAGNFIVAIFTFLIQYVFTILVCWVLLYIVISEMLTDNLLMNAIHSFFIVLTFLTFFSFVSDQFGESIPDPRRSDDII